MTNARYPQSYQTRPMPVRRSPAPARKAPKARTLILLILPVLMVMMMLIGAAMPGINASGDTAPNTADRIVNKGNEATRVDAPITSEIPDTSDYAFVMGATHTTTQGAGKETPKPYTDRDVEVVAKTVYGEALITHSDMEMAAVVWCILNRVDSKGYACGGTIEYVTTFPGQFHGYSESHPVTDHIEELVIDVFERWTAEKNGEMNVGRVLPKEYLYFWGDGKHNYFTTEFLGGETWEWEAENPYEN
ncbi:MAG: cell wall hydrolase [Clostridia bacterium]|nr:cell wall hydrolase [Clostridia bacterium]